MAKRSISAEEYQSLRQSLQLDPAEVPRVSTRLRELRTEHGFSLAQLASMCGLAGKGTPAGWETEGQTPELGLLMMLADLYGVSMDYLVGRSKADRDSNRVRAAKAGVIAQLQECNMESLSKAERVNLAWRTCQEVDPYAFPPARVAGLVGGLSEDVFKEFLDGKHGSDVAIARFAFAIGIPAEILLEGK